MADALGRIVPEGKGYRVISPTGGVLSGWIRNRSDAEHRLDALQRNETIVRRACMCCGTRFDSEGAHNRLCGKCRGLSQPVAL